MSSWLRSLIGKNERALRGPVIELLVLEGLDAGQQFTLDGDEVLIGRRLPSGLGQRGVLLSDPTVSAKQAVIRRRGAGLVIQHMAGATNPTLVDGREAQGTPLRPGSRIQMGHVTMEVRPRDGISLSHLTQALLSDAAAGTALPSGDDGAPGADADGSESVERETTEIRPVVSQVGQLIVEQAPEAAHERSFPIWSTGVLLGRGDGCDIQLADMGVSRTHAELTWQDGKLILVHRSQVNPTLLNGCEVLDRESVCNGDVIQLADQVVLRVELGRSGVIKAESPTDARRRTLKQEMEEKIDLDRRIEEQFSVEGSFLDVDIVNSYRMKSEATRAEHIIVSFERFRAFVGEVVASFGGHVLNSNGDELMCYFESTLAAVRAGSGILTQLEDFNGQQNLLRVPFRFRIGIHTGKSLVDLDRGVAYSTILDVAGHLQKLAEGNGLVISQQTFDALPDGMPFERVGTMEREGFDYYRLTGRIE